MTYDYFYGNQSDQFSFYRIPKALFTDEHFKTISAESKILYGILLDRMNLSQKNGWLDPDGRVYIIFTVEEITEAFHCASQKAVKLLAELETKAGLIERKRQGLGKPNLLYVKNFIASSESQFKNGENHNSGMMKIETPEFPKSQCNNTDPNNTAEKTRWSKSRSSFCPLWSRSIRPASVHSTSQSSTAAPLLSIVKRNSPARFRRSPRSAKSCWSSRNPKQDRLHCHWSFTRPDRLTFSVTAAMLTSISV